jgi:hypothetical protein
MPSAKDTLVAVFSYSTSFLLMPRTELHHQGCSFAFGFFPFLYPARLLAIAETDSFLMLIFVALSFILYPLY